MRASLTNLAINVAYILHLCCIWIARRYSPIFSEKNIMYAFCRDILRIQHTIYLARFISYSYRFWTFPWVHTYIYYRILSASLVHSISLIYIELQASTGAWETSPQRYNPSLSDKCAQTILCLAFHKYKNNVVMIIHMHEALVWHKTHL